MTIENDFQNAPSVSEESDPLIERGSNDMEKLDNKFSVVSDVAPGELAQGTLAIYDIDGGHHSISVRQKTFSFNFE